MSQTRASATWKELKPFAMRDIAGLLDDGKSDGGGGGEYAIVLYDVSAQTLKYYSVSAAGLTAALAASASGDVVWVPAGTLTFSASSYTPGSEISTGAIDVTSETGHTISGLTIGQKYCVESFNGYWQPWTGLPLLYSVFQLSDGTGFSGWVGLAGLDGDSVVSPDFCIYSECFTGGDGKRYGRTYFVAYTNAISVRVADTPGEFGNNGYTLSWRLREAAFTPGVSSSITVPAGVELVGIGDNAIIDGDVINNGTLTNIQVTGTITGSGPKRLVSDGTNDWISRLNNHDHSGDVGDGGAFALTNLSSGAATNGQVPLADGAGAIDWTTFEGLAHTWTAANVFLIDDAVTDAVTEIAAIGHNSSGTPAAGFGARLAAYLESSTTAKQLAGAIDWIWRVATHATRSAYARLMLTINAAAVTKMAYVGDVAIANNTTTNLFDVALAENSGVGGEITFTAIGTNGTDFVVHTGFITYAAVDKAGTLTSQITDEGATSDATAKSSGSTLTDTWSIVDGTNKITVAANFNSNMSGTTTWKLHYEVHNGSGQEITIL